MAKLIEELAGDDGAVEEVVTPEVTDPTTGDDETGRQPKEAEQGKPKKPSLDDDPNFRKWKSEQDKKHAALQSELDRAARQRQEDAQRQAWYEQQLEALQTRDLDEPSKLAYENQKLKRMMAAIQNERDIENGRKRIFEIIQKEWLDEDGVEVPLSVFADARDAEEAWKLSKRFAVAQLKKNPSAEAQRRAEKLEANQVYLGGNSATSDDWEAKAARLLKNKDAIGYARHMLERKE